MTAQQITDRLILDNQNLVVEGKPIGQSPELQ